MTPMDILITVDTEFWPRPRDGGFGPSIRRDIDGVTPAGDYGLARQMEVLGRYGLKGVFLVEALFPEAAGIEPLQRIVDMVQSRGHEVQLHAHPEWLAWMPRPIVEYRGKNLKDFTEREQIRLLARALENLQRAGARQVSAFRAGNYGADAATLRALHHLGVTFDTSYNPAYLDSDCGLRLPDLLLQPRQIEGICEVPISYVRDFSGRLRHAQLCACSFSEMRTALCQAHALGWRTFVIVSHSFELLSRRDNGSCKPDGIVIRRFEKICRFISEHPDKFRSAGFLDLDRATLLSHEAVSGRDLRASIFATAIRLGEQAARRVTGRAWT